MLYRAKEKQLTAVASLEVKRWPVKKGSPVGRQENYVNTLLVCIIVCVCVFSENIALEVSREINSLLAPRLLNLISFYT